MFNKWETQGRNIHGTELEWSALKSWSHFGLTLGKGQLCQREAVPCEILHGIREIFKLWVWCLVGSTCVFSITLHVTTCPWLDLVGICKPRDSRRDVCGRRGSCDVEQTLFAIPWLRRDFWEMARGDSPKSLAGFYKDNIFMGMALCQPDKKWKTKGQLTPGPTRTSTSIFTG